MLSIIKNIFNHYFDPSQKTTEKAFYSISKNINNIGYDNYKNISQAIEATKGDEFYIHEKIDEKFICRGKWKDYKRQE